MFFRKGMSKVEIINDLNDNMVNFYKTIKRSFPKLHDEVDVTLYSEWQYKEAKELWLNSAHKDSILRAWSVFVLSHQSFSGIMGNSWAFSDTSNLAKRFDNVKQMFDERYVKRLEQVQIFCRDALNVIGNCDSPDTFHFIDPPYFNADMGHYDGYKQDGLSGSFGTVADCQGQVPANHLSKRPVSGIQREKRLAYHRA